MHMIDMYMFYHMKISIVSKKSTWYTEQLLNAAKKLGINASVIDICTASDITKLGDVVYWRSASIESRFPNANERSTLMTRACDQKKIIINHTLLTNPYLTHKSYQQEFLGTHNKSDSIHTIPTYTADTIKKIHELITQGILTFPFIAKPNHGSQGNGVFLIRSIEDLSVILQVTHYVFQNYMPNSGDYRIYMVGGTAIEIIERRAKDGSFLNNASQGGSVTRVSDSIIRRELAMLATKIASTFDLSICGIDIIYNTVEKKYYFLEVNTVAQWKGLQSVSTLSIAEKIIDYCQDIYISRNTPITPALVEKYYMKNISHLPKEKQFHFLSRVHLKSQKKLYKKEISAFKKNYLWEHHSVRKHITDLYLTKNYFFTNMHNGKDFRLPFIERFEKIGLYDHILFKTLFSLTVFDHDIRSEVLSNINTQELIEYYTKLTKDPQAIFALSSHAVNIIYLTQWLFQNDISSFNPQNFIEIANHQKLATEQQTIPSKIYILTHAIICASQYYAQPITQNKDSYLAMLNLLEKTIIENYTIINLDQKMEFLTCARILQYTSQLQTTILQEAEESCSPHGIFIVDTLNIHAKKTALKSFTSSEHRNVLFIMAFSKEDVG